MHPASSLAAGQAAADEVRGQRGQLLDRYKQNNLTVDQSQAYTGTNSSVSGGRSAKSGAVSGSTSRTVPMTCRKGPKNFTNSDGTFLSTLSCTSGGSLTLRVCTPDKASTDPSCPTASSGAPVTVGYTNNSITVSIASCANPATDGCDFRVQMTGSSSTNWARDTIAAEGQDASLRPEARGSASNRAAVNNPDVQAKYSAVDRTAQYSKMARIESGAASGRLVDGNGNDLGALNQGGSCVKTCLGTPTPGSTTKTCVQSLDTYTTGCHTAYPRVTQSYSINRANATCSTIHPGTCTPSSAPPAGYGGWQQYNELPAAFDRVAGDSYTIYFAAFENFSAGPPASKPPSSTSQSGPTITDMSQCQPTGGSCISYDSDVSSQCRTYQSRLYCPYDRVTTCTDSSYIAGRPTPPSGQTNATQYSNPGPTNYTLPSGRSCSIADISQDSEAMEDGEPTCTLFQDGVCVDVPGQAECNSEEQISPPPCSGPKYNGCTADSGGSCTATSPAGTCVEWTTNYTCPTTNPQCQRYRTVCSANGVVYSDEESQSGTGWTNAAATMAAIDQITSEAKDACAKNGTCDMRNLKVFNGTAEGCKKQSGSSFAGKLCDFSPPDYSGSGGTSSPCLGGPIRTNCCDEDLNKEQDSLIGGKCGSGDVSLAAARRQERAIRLGERCSDRINLGFSRPCIEREQLWCWWPTVLAKEINVQGREQLKAIYATTSSTVDGSTPMSWNYFSSSESGNWTPVKTLGTTRLMAWQWPSYCASAKDARQSNTNCGSTRESYLMTCQASDCATVVPTHPTKSSVQAPHWYAINLPRYGEGAATHALGKYGYAEGRCNGTSCNFTLTAATEARSRSSVGLMELDWPWTDPDTAVGERAMNSSYAVIAYPNAPGTPMAANATIGVSASPNLSNPNATTYTYYSIPTDGSARTITLAGKTIKVQGECDARTNLCHHRFYVPLSFTPKRWNKNGTTDRVTRVSQMDCSGFTIEEFGLLDVSKMNLEPVIAAMTNGNTGTSLAKAQITAATYAADATTTFTKKESEYNAGKTQVGNTAQYSSDVVTLTPAAGKAPWTTTMTFPSLYPNSESQQYNSDPSTRRGTPISRVTINWGDGVTTSHTPGGNMNSVPHTYGEGAGKLERDWDIVVTFQLSTGVTRTVKARAASRYDEYDQSRGSGGAQDSLDEMDTRPPVGTNVPGAR